MCSLCLILGVNFLRLADLKNNLKLTLIVFALFLYGIGAFWLGKSQNLKEFIKVKGASNQKQTIFPIGSPVPFADTQSQTITPSYVKLCANTFHGFEIAYPKDWFTTYNQEDQKCLFFAPYSFVLPQDITGFLVPITIEATSYEDWPTVSKFYENPNDLVNVISVENIQFGSLSVKKIKAETTGSGQLERGLTKITYLIFTSPKPMIVTYSQLLKGDNAQEGTQIIEEMLKSLKFF